MKIRTDFVTNSSSSSFIIAKRILDDDQILAILNHELLAKKLEITSTDWGYNIEQNDDFIAGYTSMDNFPMEKLFEVIGISPSVVTWGEYPFSLGDPPEEAEQEDKSQTWREVLHDSII